MRKKILVLEKARYIFTLLRLHADASLFDLEAESDGLVGLSKIYSYKPDLVLMDVMLDSISGFDFIQALRLRSDETRLTPVIIFSDRILVKNLFRPKDIQGFMPKPFSILELLELMKTALNNSEIARANAPRALAIGFDWEPLRAIKKVFTEEGFETDIAQDGAHALQVAITKRPAVIFVTSSLAQMNIWEFCRLVKEFPLLKDTLIVIYDAGGIFEKGSDISTKAAQIITYTSHTDLEAQTRAFLKAHF
ncbi:MAG: response regulator [Candidatus Omnitrophota bacterium]